MGGKAVESREGKGKGKPAAGKGKGKPAAGKGKEPPGESESDSDSGSSSLGEHIPIPEEELREIQDLLARIR
jgi:hypothetical protein